MVNDKQKWLHKQHKELKVQVNAFLKAIKLNKKYLSENINEDEHLTLCTKTLFDSLHVLRKKLKETEQDIRIVKQLIKETK